MAGKKIGVEASMGHSMPKHLDKYEVEHAAHVLTQHQEVKADKKLHRAAKMHLKKKHRMEKKAYEED